MSICLKLKFKTGRQVFPGNIIQSFQVHGFVQSDPVASVLILYTVSVHFTFNFFYQLKSISKYTMNVIGHFNNMLIV